MPLSLPILAFGFLSPLLFGAGAAAVSIPIIIHLLNKRRFKTVIWAAMHFLLAAQKRNARRLKLHRWLLLAIRCLALLFLAAGMARLVINANVFGNALAGQSATILLWDDSYSMGYQKPGEPSAFDRSKKLLTNFLAAAAPSDKIMLIRVSRNGQQPGNQPTLDHAALEAQVRSAQLSDASTDLPAALDQAGETLKTLDTTTQHRTLILLTDFSRSSLNGEAMQEQLKKKLAALTADNVTLSLVDLGQPNQFNMALTDLHPLRPVVVANTNAEFQATLFNATDHPQIDLPLTVYLDGIQVHTEKLGKIEPGASKTTLLQFPISTPGRHTIEAKLPPDLLPVDDTRRLILNVRKEIPVLLVEGSPGATTYLYAAYGLSVDGKFTSVFAPRRITELELPTTTLSEYSEIVLADTAVPAPNVLASLKQFVDNGGLLMLFPGDRTNAALMNDALSRSGLLPATLGQPVRLESSAELAKGFTFAPEGFAHPVLEQFREVSRTGADYGFLSVQTNEYLKLGVPTDGSVETILRYTQKDGTPGDAAIVRKHIGNGNVVLFASSADNQWNTWGGKPSYLPVINELAFYTLSPDADPLTLSLGDRINLPAEAASPGLWSAPRNSQISITTQVDKAGHQRLISAPLPNAGFYTPANADGRPMIVVNPDAAEADIRHLTTSQMSAALGIDSNTIAVNPSDLTPPAAPLASANGATLLGPALISIALSLFILEAFLAMSFSSYK